MKAETADILVAQYGNLEKIEVSIKLLNYNRNESAVVGSQAAFYSSIGQAMRDKENHSAIVEMIKNKQELSHGEVFIFI